MISSGSAKRSIYFSTSASVRLRKSSPVSPQTKNGPAMMELPSPILRLPCIPSGAEAGNGTVTITDGGTYLITGELSDGRILVNAPEKEVTIVLENTGIRCTYGSPIYIYQSRLTTLCLTEGTTNTLTDGSEYTFSDSFSSSVDEEPNACLYSKSDLVIAGSGRLIVNANYNNGIT